MAGGPLQGQVATAGRLLSVWTDGQAVPLLTVSSAWQAQWQQWQAFPVAKGSTLPAEHTASYARSACSGRQVSNVHRGSVAAPSALPWERVFPAAVPLLGEILCIGALFLPLHN